MKIQFVILSILILFSCRKYNDPIGCHDCPQVSGQCSCENIIEPKDTITGVTQWLAPISNVGKIISAPKFNPVNSNIITFYEIDLNAEFSEKRFCIYDRLSKIKEYPDFIDMASTTSYTWDFKQNLYFSKGASVFKVNYVSREISEIKFENLTTRFITWIEKLKRIGFEGTNSNNEKYYLTYNFINNDIDTFREYNTSYGVGFPMDIVWSKDLIIYKYNEKRTAIEYFKTENGSSGILARYNQITNKEIQEFSFNWLPNSNTFYISSMPGGIFYTKLDSKNVVRIKKSCGNYSYSEFDLSGNGNELLVVRSNLSNGESQYNRWDNWIYVKDELVIMDNDGCNERLLLGDE